MNLKMDPLPASPVAPAVEDRHRERPLAFLVMRFPDLIGNHGKRIAVPRAISGVISEQVRTAAMIKLVSCS
ncbi:MAG TPA: hypothetical protein VMB03_17480 [Bryobacteraceae bacterium]|nr:hypothetical protein [Bryobacteraceae bacterium]